MRRTDALTTGLVELEYAKTECQELQDMEYKNTIVPGNEERLKRIQDAYKVLEDMYYEELEKETDKALEEYKNADQ